jgi:hypothetical protein
MGGCNGAEVVHHVGIVEDESAVGNVQYGPAMTQPLDGLPMLCVGDQQRQGGQRANVSASQGRGQRGRHDDDDDEDRVSGASRRQETRASPQQRCAQNSKVGDEGG